MTRLEQEYMTRMPNEVRDLRKSIDKLVEVLQPIFEACKNRPEVGVDPNVKAIFFGLTGNITEENSKT